MKKFILYLSLVSVLFIFSSCKKEEQLEPGLILASSTEEPVITTSPLPGPKITPTIKPSSTIAPKESSLPEESPSPTITPTLNPTIAPVMTSVPKSTPIVTITTVKKTPEPNISTPVKETQKPVATPTIAPTPIPTVEPTNTPSNDIYDIVLFFGQSNMNAWPETGASMPAEFSDRHAYAVESGIDEDILNWTVSTSFVSIPIKESTGYIYKYLSNSLEMITPNTVICGDGFENSGYIGDIYENSYGGLKYNPDTKTLEQFHIGDPYISIQTSPNQNMIPEFCRRYNELTGHKVIAVTCAVGGAPIECFLPADNPNNYYNRRGATQHYMYEGLVLNFNAAVKYAADNNLTIGSKYWICFQGEGNLDDNSMNTYYDHFLEVKNNMSRDIGTERGLIVYTSGEIGCEAGYGNVLKMHDIQTLLAENPDISIGSSFDWDRFIPCESIYYSDDFKTNVYLDEAGNKLPYDKAFDMAKKITSYEYDFYNTGQNNRIHMLSCTLSQIGRDCAESLANILGF